MRTHSVRFHVAAPRHRVWRALHPRLPEGGGAGQVLTYPGGSLEVLYAGDADGQGLVRTCVFGVPRWLLSGGRARSWECVTEIRPDEYAGYRSVSRPPWAIAEGHHELVDAADGGTELTFVESYDVQNPLIRRLFERRVHERISHDNEVVYQATLSRLGAVTRLN